MTAPEGEPLLVLDRVAAVYHHVIRALDDVSLVVRQGEIVALLGANGAGKSTTLKAVSNLLPAERGRVTQGTIRFEGRLVGERTPAELVRAGVVPVLEGRRCFKSLTVEENLVSGGLGRGASRGELRQDLERVYHLFPRLADRRRSPAGVTSGGEQQMTAIGRALMARPRLLVLDEPSMGLAPLVVEAIFRALQALNRDERLSILVAEQNSAIALKYATHAVVLENGRTALDGPAAELRNRGDVKALYLGTGVAGNRQAA